ncbi:hypothetical protein [Flexivirga sp. B27]
MEVIGVDPRDQTWEVDPPKYRVYFHSDSGVSDEYELAGVDIDAVMAWAHINRADRTFVVYACVPDGESNVGLVRLAGYDPNDPDAKDRTPDPFPLPTVLAVDEERFTAVADPDQPGAWHLTWDTGPNPGYGYTTRRSDHQWANTTDLISGARSFLAEIDPQTGYLAD